ncbi:MAG TPA: hypothetical protein QF804_03550 [Rhodospirillales bacterium]|jgi:hypothetical protein|nr:hypothetical protein [Rhodospirillales bacterium]HJO68738.1 hypothetical protein [Rhodospirillales bacterium]
MSVHAYPVRTIRADYVRAGIGVVCCLAPLAVGSVVWPVAAVFVSLAALFAVFGVRAVRRQATRVRVTATGVSADGWRPVQIAWDELSAMSLAYYSTRREKAKGWMQLRLKARAGTVRVESTIEGFEAVVGTAAQAASANGVVLDRATRSNLRALGIALDEERP